MLLHQVLIGYGAMSARQLARMLRQDLAWLAARSQAPAPGALHSVLSNAYIGAEYRMLLARDRRLRAQ